MSFQTFVKNGQIQGLQDDMDWFSMPENLFSFLTDENLTVSNQYQMHHAYPETMVMTGASSLHRPLPRQLSSSLTSLGSMPTHPHLLAQCPSLDYSFFLKQNLQQQQGHIPHTAVHDNATLLSAMGLTTNTVFPPPSSTPTTITTPPYPPTERSTESLLPSSVIPWLTDPHTNEIQQTLQEEFDPQQFSFLDDLSASVLPSPPGSPAVKCSETDILSATILLDIPPILSSATTATSTATTIPVHSSSIYNTSTPLTWQDPTSFPSWTTTTSCTESDIDHNINHIISSITALTSLPLIPSSTLPSSTCISLPHPPTTTPSHKEFAFMPPIGKEEYKAAASVQIKKRGRPRVPRLLQDYLSPPSKGTVLRTPPPAPSSSSSSSSSSFFCSTYQDDSPSFLDWIKTPSTMTRPPSFPESTALPAFISSAPDSPSPSSSTLAPVPSTPQNKFYILEPYRHTEVKRDRRSFNAKKELQHAQLKDRMPHYQQQQQQHPVNDKVQ